MENHKDFWEDVNDYDNNVFSVFADKDAENPIFDYLDSKENNLTVADFGCGPGNFLKFLAERFEEVFAVDYSKTMLEMAKQNNPNIEFKKLDLNNLTPMHNSVDIAISVNSILPKKVQEVDNILSEIYKTIKKGGEFVGILPSADVVHHMALLEYQQQLAEGKDEKEIEEKIESKFRKFHQTSLLGFHRDSDKDPRQKYFYPSEIHWRLKKAGFKSVELQKVYYSWDYCKHFNYGYFPEHERIWDWFVVAKK